MRAKKIIKSIFALFPIKNIILMESNPDFTDNARHVFDKLIENNVNDKYKIVWFVKNSKEFRDIKFKNVKFVSVYSKYNIFKKINKIYYNSSAKIIIDCNNYIPKVKDKQFRIYLTHGTPLKNAEAYCKDIGDVNYILEIGEFFRNENSKLFDIPKERILHLGFPRNDELFLNITINEIFPEYNGKKVIVWLPTYRKHKEHEKYKNSILKYGLPAINSAEDFVKINKILEENNTIILIKLHPAQDRSVIESFKCNNLKIITDEQLAKKGFNLYKLLAASDALITDYSAVYYDYLLTKKPIGLAITDIEEYKENAGLVYDYYKTIKGEYIYNSDELCYFIKNLAAGKDNFLEERLNCLKLYHTYYDNKSSERVYEFIKKYL